MQIQLYFAAAPPGKTPPYPKLEARGVKSAQDNHKHGRGKSSAEERKSVRSTGVSRVQGVQRYFEHGTQQYAPIQHDLRERTSRSGEVG